MIRDEQLDVILGMLDSELDDAELNRREASFRSALRRLRDDPAQAARIDALAARAGDNPGMVSLITRGAGGQQTAAALVTGAVEGDPAAWEAIVERYAPLLWSICSRYQLDNSDREDVAQTVWQLLVKHLGKLREPAALPGWLASTTQHECLRVVTAARKRERLGTGPDDTLQFADDTMIEEDILMAERRTALRAAFAQLPPRCQQLLAMLTTDPPYSYAEISDRLNIPVGSVGPRRGRCLGRLRRIIAMADPGDADPRWG